MLSSLSFNWTFNDSCVPLLFALHLHAPLRHWEQVRKWILSDCVRHARRKWRCNWQIINVSENCAFSHLPYHLNPLDPFQCEYTDSVFVFWSWRASIQFLVEHSFLFLFDTFFQFCYFLGPNLMSYQFPVDATPNWMHRCSTFTYWHLCLWCFC